ncbi:MAG: hypothetical protein M3380_03060, partial [Chloroflexota bacterium]|nr:hypothetical protein [Chloroflexota bacterium]
MRNRHALGQPLRHEIAFAPVFVRCIVDCFRRAEAVTLPRFEPSAWLQPHVPPEWIKRYGRRFDSYHFPKGEAERTALAEQIGRDGVALLKAIWVDEAPVEVRTLPIVDVLRRIWVQQFYLEAETVHWR